MEMKKLCNPSLEIGPEEIRFGLTTGGTRVVSLIDNVLEDPDCKPADVIAWATLMKLEHLSQLQVQANRFAEIQAQATAEMMKGIVSMATTMQKMGAPAEGASPADFDLIGQVGELMKTWGFTPETVGPPKGDVIRPRATLEPVDAPAGSNGAAKVAS